MKLLVPLLLIISAGSAWAAPSGLMLIPTADLLASGQTCLEYQVGGQYPIGSGVESAFLNTQQGVGDRSEFGVDFDFTAGAETGLLLNGKLMLRDVQQDPGLAVGVQDIGEGASATIYLTAVKRLADDLRLHAGALHISGGSTCGFAGVDYAVNDRLAVYGEYLTGNENASALTLAYQVTESWGVAFAWQEPNDSEAKRSFAASIGCVRPTG